LHTNPNTTQTHSQPCRKGHIRSPQMIPPDWSPVTFPRFSQLSCSRSVPSHS
jgi:hypothetical protein